MGGAVRGDDAPRDHDPHARRGALDRRQPAGWPASRGGDAAWRAGARRRGAHRGAGEPHHDRCRRPLDDVTASSTRRLVDRLADDVWTATGGHPLSVTEPSAIVTCCRRRTGLPRLDAIVAGTLAQLDADDRRLVDLLAVASRPTPVGSARGGGSLAPADVLARAERLLDEGIGRRRRATASSTSATTSCACRRHARGAADQARRAGAR